MRHYTLSSRRLRLVSETQCTYIKDSQHQIYNSGPRPSIYGRCSSSFPFNEVIVHWLASSLSSVAIYFRALSFRISRAVWNHCHAEFPLHFDCLFYGSTSACYDSDRRSLEMVKYYSLGKKYYSTTKSRCRGITFCFVQWLTRPCRLFLAAENI